MKKKLSRFKQIETEVNQNYRFEKYRALCEMIAEGELSLSFLDIAENQQLLGKDNVDREKQRLTQAISIRKAEKNFLENVLK